MANRSVVVNLVSGSNFSHVVTIKKPLELYGPTKFTFTEPTAFWSFIAERNYGDEVTKATFVLDLDEPADVIAANVNVANQMPRNGKCSPIRMVFRENVNYHQLIKFLSKTKSRLLTHISGSSNSGFSCIVATPKQNVDILITTAFLMLSAFSKEIPSISGFSMVEIPDFVDKSRIIIKSPFWSTNQPMPTSSYE